MIATAYAKSIEEIKSFLSRQKEDVYKRQSLFHTLAQAMSSIVYAAEKKEIAVSVDCLLYTSGICPQLFSGQTSEESKAVCDCLWCI